MARLRYRADLEPLPRGWFDHAAGLLHDTLGECLGGPDLPLVDGWALQPGARYVSPDHTLRVKVESWSRGGRTSVELHTNSDDMLTTCLARLDSASAPRTVELDGDTRDVARGTGSLTAMTGSLRADLELWWTGTAQPGGEPAIVGWADISLLHARFAVTPAPGPGGRWRVTLRTKVRGRGVIRPLAAVGLLVAGRKLKRTMVAQLDAFVQEWNRQVPAVVAMPPDELRELITAELVKASRSG